MNSKPLSYYMALPELVNEHPFMREIHAIRLKIYDDTKSMTQAERTVHNQNSRAETEVELRHLGWNGGH